MRILLLLLVVVMPACTFVSTSTPTPLGKVLLKAIVPACDPTMAPCQEPT